MHKLEKIFIILFLMILIIPLLNFNLKSESVSELDNRYLAEFPTDKKLNGEFEAGLTNYVNDRIGFREDMIRVYTQMNDKIYNELVHPSFMYGKDGYVFWKTAWDKFTDYEFLDSFADMLLEIQTYCEERDVPFLYVLDPFKNTVYQDYLPEGYNFTGTRLKYIREALDKRKINYLDNTDFLIEKHKKEQIYNVKYDAGHWNDLGAFYGINNIFTKLQELYPGIELNDIKDFNVSTKVEPSLQISEFPINETVPLITPKNIIEENTKYYDEIKLDSVYKYFAMYDREAYADNLPNKALFFQGSYLNTRPLYLAGHFNQYIAINNYQNTMKFDYYFNIYKPDLVVIESAEYTTRDAYFNPDRVKNFKLNTALESYSNLNEEVVDTSIKINYNFGNSLATYEIPFLDNESFEAAYLSIDDEVFDVRLDQDSQIHELSIDKEKYNEDNVIKLIVIKDNMKYIYENIKMNYLEK